jgi:flagellar biosynthesis protein FlhG
MYLVNWDQAAGLRRMMNSRPVQVIAVTSGKGGVGKTNVSVNLAAALAQTSRQVMLMDADLGLANVDVMLGVHPKYNLSHVINGDKTLEDIIVQGPFGMNIIPAASGIQQMAELSKAQHAGLIRGFSSLGHSLDYLLVDTAAGISDGVISFTKAARQVVVVVCDEPSSITDAYAMIKVLSRDHGVSKFHILANMIRSPQEGQSLFAKLTKVTSHYLDVTLELLGGIPFDENLRRAVKTQKCVVEAFPMSPAAKMFRYLADKMNKWPAPRQAEGHLEFFVERLIQYRSELEGAAL